MRLLARLLVAVVISVVAIAFPAAPALGAAAPTFSLNHNSGVPGDEIAVSGNFTGNDYVDIYFDEDDDGEFAEEEWVNDGVVDSEGLFYTAFEVPVSFAGNHGVQVRGHIIGTAEKSFTVRPGLTVNPEDGPVGANVTVRGAGFGKNEESIQVRYYYTTSVYDTVLQNIEADENGSWEKSFPVPSSCQAPHRIGATGESSALNVVRDTTFETAPAISLARASGSPGQSITMTGTGFYANNSYIEILFQGEEAQAGIIRADPNGYWQGSFQVPAMPTGTYSLTAGGGQMPETDVTPLNFQIRPGLVLSPGTGHVGMLLTVNGYGFPINERVNVLYEGNQTATAETDTHGTFQANFLVPESQHGPRTVTTEDAADNVASAIFTMESVPPGTPEPDSPEDGSTMGFVGSVKPTFKWSAVSDPSGVYYSLQIAVSDNTTGSGLLNPIISVDNIVATNYTLEKGLGYGNYYWIVQAVDGAGNKGQWTTPRSFHAGALPLWAFILAIVVFLALVGTLVYRLVIRERIRYL